MKFTLAFEKRNRSSIGQSEGHNTRLHPTASQLPKEAWITKEGLHELMPWRSDLLDQAKGLAKRKDAVLAVELVFQVGNQTEWRKIPTKEHPHGERIPGASEKLNKICAGVEEAAILEFGKERIVSISMHTDESTPHVHVVFVPIHDGKLQAKHWLNGPLSCAQLRERLHAPLNKHFACDYEKGAAGGAPHNALKAAGAPLGPKPKPGLLEAAKDALTGAPEIKRLKDLLEKAHQQIQNLFSQAKRDQKKAEQQEEFLEIAHEKAKNAIFLAAELKEKNAFLEAKIEALKPKKAPEIEPAAPISDAVLKKKTTVIRPL